MVKPHGGFKPFGALLFLVEQVDFRKPSQQFRSYLVWPWQEHLRSGFVTEGIFTCADNSSGIQVFPPAVRSQHNRSLSSRFRALLLVRFVVVSESAAVKSERCSNGISVPQRLPYPDNPSDHRVQPHGKCPRSCSESESQQLQAESLVQGKDGIKPNNFSCRTTNGEGCRSFAID
jgi:hypothetical protein